MTIIVRTIFVISFLLLSGCTTIGLHNAAKKEHIDFSEPSVVRICILKDREISQERTDEILAAIREEWKQYGIQVEIPWIRPWNRAGFWSDNILREVAMRSLIPPCDRLFGLTGRHTGDFFWGILMPEILGAVETKTFTKGFAAAEWGSLSQTFLSPASIAVHESYHLFGCGHALIMNSCYGKIKMIKDIANQERERGSNFFPTISDEGYILRTREEVDNVYYQLIQNYFAADFQNR